MPPSIEMLLQLIVLSSGFWLIWGFISILLIKGFLVKRYEVETQLSKTIYFTIYMPFVRYLPKFFRSGFYVVHLLHFVWFWRFVKFVKEKRPNAAYFDDIGSPEEITRHFSSKEILKAKITAFLVIMVSLHVTYAHTILYTMHRIHNTRVLAMLFAYRQHIFVHPFA